MFWGSNFTFTFANVIKCWQCNSRFQSFSVQLKFHFHMAGRGQFHMHLVVNVRPLCKSQSTILQTQLTKWMFDQRAREWTSHTEKVAFIVITWPKGGRWTRQIVCLLPAEQFFGAIEQLFGILNNYLVAGRIVMTVSQARTRGDFWWWISGMLIRFHCGCNLNLKSQHL